MTEPVTLTRSVRDRAVAALWRAHNEGRPLMVGGPRDATGRRVCSCWVITEEFDRAPAANSAAVYDAMESLGFQRGFGGEIEQVWHTNDGLQSFAAVADVVATFDVVEEAEAITRHAVMAVAT